MKFGEMNLAEREVFVNTMIEKWRTADSENKMKILKDWGMKELFDDKDLAKAVWSKLAKEVTAFLASQVSVVKK